MKRNCRWIAALAAVALCRTAFATTDWSAQDYDLYPGDFDGDGRADVLYVAKDPTKASGIARSDGSAPNLPFQSWPSNYLGIPWFGNQYNVIVADFSGDHRADIFLQSVSPSGFSYVLIADSAGKITGLTQSIAPSSAGVVWTADQHRIVAGDFNGDGLSDLFLQATRSSGLNAVMLASTGGTFVSAPAQSWTDTGAPGGFKWSTQNALVYAGDFAGDSRTDLLVQAKPQWVTIDYDVAIPVPIYPPNLNGVVIAQSSGTLFSSAAMKAWSRNSNGADWSTLNGNVVVGDFDGNGKADVLLQAKSSGQTSRLILADGSPNIFAAASTAITANVSIAGSAARLLAAKFGSGPSASLYIQTLQPSGTNSIASTVSATISASTHDPAAATGTLPVTAVGRTPGSFAVSDRGSATYSIPIVVPPGVANLQPSLAIAYGSDGGNSLLGVGWGLAGLSAIERCRKTTEQDGANDAPQLSVADVFCLDGNRLRVYGSVGYGQPGSTYRTEVETFRRITANSAVGFGPLSFTVEAKDGLRYEYGTTADSRIESTAPGRTTTVRVWALSKVSDRYGNFMSISYQEDGANGSFRPANITYTANTGASLVASYRVDFIWETRPDTLRAYFAGGPIVETQRLSRIQTLYRNPSSGVFGVVRQYRLSYNNSGISARSRLGAVQECDRNGLCLAPTMIGWQDGSKQWESASTAIAGTSGALGAYAIPIDFNGDGRTDLVYPQQSGATIYWHYLKANASGGYDAPVATSIVAGDMTNLQFTKAVQLDYYGDGLTGLLAQVPGQTNLQLIRWNGATLAATATTLTQPLDGSSWTGDFNGDGRMDFAYVVYNSGTQVNSIFVQTNSGSTSGSAAFGVAQSFATVSFPGKLLNPYVGSQSSAVGSVFDFNSDGRTDLMYRVDTSTCGPFNPEPLCAVANYVLMLSTVGAFSPAKDWSCAAPPGLPCPNPIIADLNADGLLDVLGPSSYRFDDQTGFPASTWYLLSGTGMTLTDPLTVSVFNTLPIWVVDYDGDGRKDVLSVGSSSLGFVGYQALRFNGVDFDAPKATGFTGTANDRVVDVDGDGLIDFASQLSSQNYTFTRHRGSIPDLVTSVSDGFGNSVTYAYAPLTDGSVYTKVTGKAIAFPQMLLTPTQSVVRQYIASDGVGGSYTTTATYAGARVHLQGRGSQGFEYRTLTDGRTSIKTTINFRQDFPYTGLPESIVTTQANGKKISETINQHQMLTQGTAPYGLRYFPYAQTRTDNRYEVSSDPAVDGLEINRTTTTTTPDSYGNPGNVTVAVQDRTDTSKTYTQQMVTAYAPAEEANWCLDVVTNKTITRSSTVPGQGTDVRTVQFIKDSAAPQLCRANRMIQEPNDALFRVQTDFLFDSYGHVRQATESATGVANRVTTVDYGPQGVLPVSITNAANEVVARTYKYEFGLPDTMHDASQLQTTFNYDGFGRQSFEQRADGTQTTWTYQGCTNANGFCGDSLLRFQVVRQNLEVGGATVVDRAVQLFDSMERGRYSQTQTVSGAYATVRTDYNNRGLISARTEPYLSGAPAYGSSYGYDSMERLTSIQRRISESNSGTQTTQFSYSRLSSKRTDPNNKETTTLRDAVGRVVQVTDAASGVTKYGYDATANLTSITDPANNLQSATYIHDRRMDSTDPDRGFWSYTYYPTGELKQVTDAKSHQITFEYDPVSRVTKRIELDSPQRFATYGYGLPGSGAKNVGKLIAVGSSSGVFSRSLTYDALGRLQDSTTTIDGTAYVVSNGYNANTGLLETLTYPTSTAAVPGSRFKVKYEYANGLLQRVRDANALSTVFWEQTASDARGSVVDEQLGNGLHTHSHFDAISGLLLDRQTGATSQVQNLVYDWDGIGNLAQRQDLNAGRTEHFYYDSLYRLDYSTLNGVTNLDMAYDAIGNIQSKSDVGSYTYHATKKHAVATAGSHSFAYDPNGNVQTRDGSTITWSWLDFPTQINSGSNSTQIFYSGTDERYKQIALTAVAPMPSGTETTLYVDGLFEKVTKPSAVIEYKHYIPAASSAVAIRTIRSSGTNDTRYLHRDHLGGVAAVTNESGGVVAAFGYDSYGARRSAATWSGPPAAGDWSTVAGVTHRGFTDQEHLDNVALIHMNGRVYDPLVGRFLSADPIIPDMQSSQSLNRYGYVSNNPLSFIDPSGFACVSLSGPGLTRSDCDSGGLFGGAGGGGVFASMPALQFTQINVDVAMLNLPGSVQVAVRTPWNELSFMKVLENRTLWITEYEWENFSDNYLYDQMVSAHDMQAGPQGPQGAESAAGVTVVKVVASKGGWKAVLGGLFTLRSTQSLPELARLLGRTGLSAFGETVFRGLVQNRPLRELTDAEAHAAFQNTRYTLSGHAVSRLLDPRTANLGIKTLNDVAGVLNKGVIEDAGDGLISITQNGFAAIVNPTTNVIVTFRPL